MLTVIIGMTNCVFSDACVRKIGIEAMKDSGTESIFHDKKVLFWPENTGCEKKYHFC